MTQVFMVYKSPSQQRAEAVIGYFVGLALALALRAIPGLPSMASLAGFLAGFLSLSLLNIWRLKRQGGVLSADEIAARYAQDAAQRSFLVSALEKAIGFIILVGTVVVLAMEGPIAGTLTSYRTQPWLYGFLLVAGLAAGFHRASREKRLTGRLDGAKESKLLAFHARHHRWFGWLAAAIFFSGLLGSAYLHGAPVLARPFPWLRGLPGDDAPAVYGLFAAVLVFLSNGLMAKLRTDRQDAGLSRALARTTVVGVLFWGVPMGLLGALAEIAVAIVRWGPLSGAAAYDRFFAFLSQIVPFSFAITALGGLFFGVTLGLFVTSAMGLSRQRS